MLFFVEAVGHVAVADFATVDAITDTSELPAPVLHDGETHAHQPGQFAGPGTISHAFITDLKSLVSVVGRGQSSTSSPQKV